MSRFVVVSEASVLAVKARSTVHPVTLRAPLAGEIEAAVTAGRIDVETAITALLDVDLTGLRGDDAHLDGETRRRLDIPRYPQATAEVHRVSAVGSDVYRLHGDLTLHGVTRELEGDAHVTVQENQLQATGSITIDIRDFAIKPPRLLLLRVDPLVEITINLVATTDEIPVG